MEESSPSPSPAPGTGDEDTGFQHLSLESLTEHEQAGCCDGLGCEYCNSTLSQLDEHITEFESRFKSWLASKARQEDRKCITCQKRNVDIMYQCHHAFQCFYCHMSRLKMVIRGEQGSFKCTGPQGCNKDVHRTYECPHFFNVGYNTINRSQHQFLKRECRGLRIHRLVTAARGGALAGSYSPASSIASSSCSTRSACTFAYPMDGGSSAPSSPGGASTTSVGSDMSVSSLPPAALAVATAVAAREKQRSASLDISVESPTGRLKAARRDATGRTSKRYSRSSSQPALGRRPPVLPPQGRGGPMSARRSHSGDLSLAVPGSRSRSPSPSVCLPSPSVLKARKKRKSLRRSREPTELKRRANWDKGTPVAIYSEEGKRWFLGEIADIFYDEQGEWLNIAYDFQGPSGQAHQELHRWSDLLSSPRMKDIASHLKGSRPERQRDKAEGSTGDTSKPPGKPVVPAPKKATVVPGQSQADADAGEDQFVDEFVDEFIDEPADQEFFDV